MGSRARRGVREMGAFPYLGTDEHVRVPIRKHQHPDGHRCILTTHGRWMREGLGISPVALCDNPEEADQ